MTDYTDAAEALNRAELGTVFTIYPNGTYQQPDELAPDALYYIEGEDTLEGAWGQWQPVAGLSGQHGYSGPIMHPSEYTSAGTVAHLMQDRTEPLGVVLVPVMDDSYEIPTGDDICGWAILTHNRAVTEP